MKLTAFCKRMPFIRRLFQGQTLLVMKITSILLLAACLQVSATGTAQHVTLSVKKVSLESLFKEIQQQTDYHFIYTRAILEDTKEVTIEVKDESIEQVLNEVFHDLPLNFTIVDKYIVIKRKPAPAPPPTAPPATRIRGSGVSPSVVPIVRSDWLAEFVEHDCETQSQRHLSGGRR